MIFKSDPCFKSSIIRKIMREDEPQGLVNDFKGYKLTGIVPNNFGRDALYDHPNNLPIVLAERVNHIHLGSIGNPLPSNVIQFYKTSDIHLVYCQGAINDSCYLLMAILSPNAHEQAKSRDVMYKLGVMAEKFRSQF